MALQNVELEQDSGWHRVKALFDARYVQIIENKN